MDESAQSEYYYLQKIECLEVFRDKMRLWIENKCRGMQTLIDFKCNSDNNHINQHRNPAYFELEWDRRQSAVQSDANGGGDEH